MSFKQFYNESLLQQVTDKFKGMIKVIPEEYSYEISINGLTIKDGIHNVAYIPKRESDNLEMMQNHVQNYKQIASQEKKVEISKLDAELKRAIKTGKKVDF